MARPKIKKATVKDIARAANVSPTAVSLVLQDHGTSRVGAETRKRILEIVEKLNYRPNYTARSLVKNESQTLGLVINTLLKPFYSELAQDIIDRAQEHGYGVTAGSVRDGLEDEKRAINDLLDRGVDGLIVCSAYRRDPVVLDVVNSGVSVVLANRTIDDEIGSPMVDYVGIDNKRGAFLAVDHLLQLGHRRIALITGPQELSTGHDRLMGARAAFEGRHVDFDEALVFQGDFNRTSGYRLTMEMLALSERPTALFAASDHMAIGALEALREKGLQAPGDMAIVGFDDTEMAGLPGVDLTTVSQKKSTIGHLAVDTLIEKIRHETRQLVIRKVLEPTLVIRKTCGYRPR